MTTVGVALPCPECRRVLEPHAWHDATSGTCRSCSTTFEFIPFPALTASRTAAVPQAAVVDAESVCFFHPQNRAESVCEECGRFVCAVCAVPFMGRKLCPACISASTKKAEAAPVVVRDRVLHESIAASLAILPILLFFVTIVTAPVALGYVVYAWNKPGSLIRGRRRWLLVLAGLIALAEIAGWMLLFPKILHAPHPRAHR